MKSANLNEYYLRDKTLKKHLKTFVIVHLATVRHWTVHKLLSLAIYWSHIHIFQPHVVTYSDTAVSGFNWYRKFSSGKTFVFQVDNGYSQRNVCGTAAHTCTMLVDLYC